MDNNQNMGGESSSVKIEQSANIQMHGYTGVNHSPSSNGDEEQESGGVMNSKNNPNLMEAHITASRNDRPAVVSLSGWVPAHLKNSKN